MNLDESLNINIRIPQKLLWTIISNLLDNAIRFTDKGYISLCSKLEQDLLYINVKDTGSGFDINLCQSLLEPFNIGENYINKSKCGIGLGLSVVNKLVKLLNGEIKVESKINEGTEFIVVLDLKKEFS
ncbi:MAG: ATP-binding protein [Exilispira sp.]